jgi:hypothetical protein
VITTSTRAKLAVIGILFVVVGHISSERLAAQDLAYFHALAIPPRSVGTCLPAAPRNETDRPSLTQYKLVMTSSAPFRRRDIGVVVDSAGRLVSYEELGFASTGLLSSEGESIVAAIDSNGHMHGWRTQSTTVLPDSARLGLDTAQLRKLQDSGITKAAREPLDAGAQRRVLEMAEWLRKRCGP